MEGRTLSVQSDCSAEMPSKAVDVYLVFPIVDQFLSGERTEIL